MINKETYSFIRLGPSAYLSLVFPCAFVLVFISLTKVVTTFFHLLFFSRSKWLARVSYVVRHDGIMQPMT